MRTLGAAIFTASNFVVGMFLGILISLLTGCGCGAKSVPKQVLPSSPGPISVQLNDAWNQSFPSESVQTSDARYFNPPSAVNVVQGVAQCWDGSAFFNCTGPEKALRARITFGAEVCEYQANNTNDTQLLLVSCGALPIAPVQLPAGTVITLDNYDAPGQLLEVSFTLTN